MKLFLLLLAFLQDDVTAIYRVTPREVEVGEPFSLVLELEHAATTSVYERSAGELALDDSWVLFDDLRPAPEVLDAGRRRTRRIWTLASLEPGPRMLADLLPILDGVASVDASATSVEVRSVLAEGEDAPRPVHGFPPGFGQGRPEAERSKFRWAFLAGAIVLWAALFALLWVRFRRRRPVAERKPSPMERLQSLQAEPATDALRVCARHFALTQLVREAADSLAGHDRCGLTDAEWLATVRGTRLLTPAVETLLSRAEAVKYGGVVPTSWALEEAHASAWRALEELEGVGNTVGGEADGDRRVSA